ncbi:MAG TPA: hypothetical protein V6D18_20140 [Thermosynechococcaceae cyanobacterium]
MVTLAAKDLSLNEVHHLLNLQRRDGQPFSDLLSLEPVTETEQQDLRQIRDDFGDYLNVGRVLEGQIQFLVVAPLLRLAGFYRLPIYISLEQGIAPIEILDEDTKITGRMDLLAARQDNLTRLWVLVLETKNSASEALNGLPQLLTYAFTSLEQQQSVWGLTTNGLSYRFVYLQAGDPATYHIMPELNLIDDDRALQLLQILKAVRMV